MRVYAFDVDDTLEVSAGPVTLDDLRRLRAQGDIVGLNGNWAVVTGTVPEWHRLFSFVGPLGLDKWLFLQQIGNYVPADEYVMVGNDPADFTHAVSNDRDAARFANWRFIRERDFAAGAR